MCIRDRAVEYGRASRYMLGHAGHLARRGQTYLACDRIEDALSSAQEALDMARRVGERGSEVAALRLHGAICMHRARPDVDGAESMFREALHLAAHLGARPQVAQCHLDLGKLYRRTDKREQAQEHLATATTMYREMGMTYWLEKAEAEVQEPG